MALCLISQAQRQFYLLPHRKRIVSVTKTNLLMLLRDIIIGYSENRTKQVNTPYGQNVDLVMLTQVAHRYHCAFKFLRKSWTHGIQMHSQS
jgi:hypothetical protein